MSEDLQARRSLKNVRLEITIEGDTDPIFSICAIERDFGEIRLTQESADANPGLRWGYWGISHLVSDVLKKGGYLGKNYTLNLKVG